MFVRSCTIALIMLLAACGSKSNAAFEFPRVAGEWRLAQSRVLPANPQTASPATRVFEAAYQRNGDILVHAYELPSETVAFETTQKFRHGVQLGFHKGSRFFTVESATLDRSALAEFASALQQALSAQQ